MTELYKENARKFIHRHVTVGVARTQLINDTGFNFVKGILLRAPGGLDPTPNTVCVWVGGPAVTPDSTAATGGMPLAPGESMFIPTDFEEGDIYLVTTENNQDIAWMGV